MLIFTNAPTESSLVLNAEIIFSVLAILISIASLFVENYLNSKNNTLSIEADIIKMVYDDYLIKKIPESRKKIIFNGQKVTGTDEFIEVLNKIRQDSLFYKYKDVNFYITIKESLQQLEDYVIENVVMDMDEYKKYDDKISKDIESIYNRIVNKQMGKRDYKKTFIYLIKNNILIAFLTTIIIILLMYILFL